MSRWGSRSQELAGVPPIRSNRPASFPMNRHNKSSQIYHLAGSGDSSNSSNNEAPVILPSKMLLDRTDCVAARGLEAKYKELQRKKKATVDDSESDEGFVKKKMKDKKKKKIDAGDGKKKKKKVIKVKVADDNHDSVLASIMAEKKKKKKKTCIDLDDSGIDGDHEKSFSNLALNKADKTLDLGSSLTNTNVPIGEGTLAKPLKKARKTVSKADNISGDKKTKKSKTVTKQKKKKQVSKRYASEDESEYADDYAITKSPKTRNKKSGSKKKKTTSYFESEGSSSDESTSSDSSSSNSESETSPKQKGKASLSSGSPQKTPKTKKKALSKQLSSPREPSLSSPVTSQPSRIKLQGWLNMPSKRLKNEVDKITMAVPRRTEMWCKTRANGAIIDTAPFHWTKVTGDFQMVCKISGGMYHGYDRAGLVLRENESNWVFTGMEHFDGRMNHTTIITSGSSDRSLAALPPNAGKFGVWFSIKRIGDAFECFYSFEGKVWVLSRQGILRSPPILYVGICGASPHGEGFKAHWEHFGCQKLLQ